MHPNKVIYNGKFDSKELFFITGLFSLNLFSLLSIKHWNVRYSYHLKVQKRSIFSSIIAFVAPSLFTSKAHNENTKHMFACAMHTDICRVKNVAEKVRVICANIRPCSTNEPQMGRFIMTIHIMQENRDQFFSQRYILIEACSIK